MTNRRNFMIQLSVGSSILLSGKAFAEGAMAAETDPMAVSLGYKIDASKVDSAKYPKHTSAQACNNCQLFQGKPSDAMGGCPLFAGKQVSAKGWCSAYAKKA